MTRRLFSFALILTCLSGCTTYSLEELRHTDPRGSAFENALAKYYLEFATSEAKEYDWMDSMRFADKGLLAAYGNEIGPEEIKDWNIPAEVLPALTKAREDLLAALTPQTIEKKPDTAALAQFYFDCWVEQQEENWQVDDIARCRDGLAYALEELAEEKPLPEKAQKDKYTVFFQWGQTIITPDAQRVIDTVVQSLEPEKIYEVTLNGHTDTSGSGKYNLMLSKKRAEAVRKRLIEGGIDEKTIKIFAYGESDPLIKTADNVKETKNRRVEIFLSE